MKSSERVSSSGVRRDLNSAVSSLVLVGGRVSGVPRRGGGGTYLVMMVLTSLLVGEERWWREVVRWRRSRGVMGATPPACLCNMVQALV